jgi:hypothetical protein
VCPELIPPPPALATEVIGKVAPDGECGINASPGLITKGHPIGATELQVKSPRLASTSNIGGPICTVPRAAS